VDFHNHFYRFNPQTSGMYLHYLPPVPYETERVLYGVFKEFHPMFTYDYKNILGIDLYVIKNHPSAILQRIKERGFPGRPKL
jgi:hypothetical protein